MSRLGSGGEKKEEQGDTRQGDEHEKHLEGRKGGSEGTLRFTVAGRQQASGSFAWFDRRRRSSARAGSLEVKLKSGKLDEVGLADPTAAARRHASAVQPG